LGRRWRTTSEKGTSGEETPPEQFREMAGKKVQETTFGIAGKVATDGDHVYKATY